LGVIQKQSISGVIYSYIGVGLGFFITVILFTRFLTTEQIGLLRLLVSYSTIIAMFASLGINSVTIKLFPYFRNVEKKHHGYLGIALLVSLIGFFIATLVYIFLQPHIIEKAHEKSALFIPYFYYVVPLALFTLLFGIFDTYYRVLYNAVKGIIYKEVLQRVFILAAVLLYYFGIVDFNKMVWLYVFALISPSLLLWTALIRSKQLFITPVFGFVDKTLSKKMFNVALFGILASFSGVIVQTIDVIMVNDYLGLSLTGIYSISFFFGALILVPMRTMGKIGSVVISDAWKINDRSTILDIYRKSSLSLSIIGLLLFIGIWGNIDNVFQIIGEEFEQGKYVIFFIGLANLTDVFMGMSSHIIVNSKYYRWLTYLILIFAAIVIITNILLIPIYGIIGAALASFVSKFIFNILKFIFVFKKFGFQPFDHKHLILLLIAVVSWYLSSLLPALPNYIFDIVLRSTIISVVFLVPVYFFKISEDINAKIDTVLMDIGIKRKR
jgi:O-antigen/teichoic acid export membrane protein